MSVTVTGMDQLNRELMRLWQEPNKAAGTAAVSAGVNVLAKVYRQHAPTSKATTRNKRAFRTSGIAVARTPMKQSVGQKIRRGSGKRGPIGKVGFNVNRRGDKRAPHAHLIVLGTKMRRNKAGQNRGRILSDRRVGQAVRSAIPQAIQAMRSRLLERLQSR